MLEPLDISAQDLYDGLEDGFYTRAFVAPVDDISFTLDDLGRFEELPARIGDAAFEQVIAETRERPTDFLIRDGRLLVFAVGERNAGRLVVTLQGAWRLG